MCSELGDILVERRQRLSKLITFDFIIGYLRPKSALRRLLWVEY